MSDKPPKQMKGFGRKLLSRRRHFSLSRVAIGKRHKSGISPPGPTTSDSDAMPKSELRQLRWRTPAGDRCKSLRIIRNSGLCSEGHDVFILISDRDNYCLFYQSASIDVEFQ